MSAWGRLIIGLKLAKSESLDCYEPRHPCSRYVRTCRNAFRSPNNRQGWNNAPEGSNPPGLFDDRRIRSPLICRTRPYPARA